MLLARIASGAGGDANQITAAARADDSIRPENLLLPLKWAIQFRDRPAASSFTQQVAASFSRSKGRILV